MCVISKVVAQSVERVLAGWTFSMYTVLKWSIEITFIFPRIAYKMKISSLHLTEKLSEGNSIQNISAAGIQLSKCSYTTDTACFHMGCAGFIGRM